MRFLRRNWRNSAELVDLRQDIYARIYDAARAELPLQTKAFLFATARNHLINCARRARVISIELVADLEALSVGADAVTPDRDATAREELYRVQAGLDRLPARCREVIVLRKIEGLSQREVAARMGIGEDTVERQVVQGMRALVDFMLGGSLRSLAWIAAAAVLVLSVALIHRYGDLFTRDLYATAIGGHEIVPLPDGSRIELNTDTRVRTSLTADTRSVWLERGEAYFDVARDPYRPFVVYAGNRRVTVLGTKFSVRLDPDAKRVQLAVAEGRVQFDELRVSEPAPPMIAIGGEKVIAEGAATRVESRSAQSVETDLSWRQGLLTFDQTTLAAAAEEFNRYNRKRLVVAPAAAEIRIGGSFEAANVDGFVRLLHDSFGLNVAESDGEISISE